MIINGKEIQKEIALKLKQKTNSRNLILDIIYVGENKVIEKYINAKKNIGESLGIQIRIHRFEENIEVEEIKKNIDEISLDSNGIIIQLPLPQKLKEANILEYVDPSLDVDILTKEAYNNFLLNKNKRVPPVVRACIYILGSCNISLQNKNICILGNGKLVGKPISDWCAVHNLPYEKLTTENFDPEVLLNADIVFSGIGKSHFVKSEMVKDGVVIFDAGTTEESGSILGDVDPEVSKKASIFTPVPGGIGPLTVIALFNNLVDPYDD
jgi:methylenetetrahydrofolate dehydrogenase (NADP+)/methenyltetrahydrofolate cyclohydrolase